MVLVVDDDPDVSLLCRLHLEQAGFGVSSAPDGMSGLVLARDERPAAIVLDFMLPDMDGIEVIGALQADPVTATIPVVMLTARAGDRDQQAAWEAGVSDYVVKPFDGARLAEAVWDALDPGGEAQRDGRRREAIHRLRARDIEVWQRRAALVDHAQDAIIGATIGGIVTDWNEAASDLFGYEADEVLGRHISILAPSNHGDELPGVLERVIRRERITHFEAVRQRRDGRRVDVSLSVSPIKDDGGVITGVSVIARDVTARRRSEARFRALVETAPDAMVIVDGRGLIELVNTQTEKLFGYARDELLGQTVEILVPEDLRGVHPDHRQRYFAEPRTRPMGAGLDLVARRKDGSTFPAEISLASIETDDGLLVTAAIRDVTWRRQAEEAQAHAYQREREASQRLREVDRLRSDFLSTVSHELRTPLSAIRGFSELLTGEWDSFSDEQRQEFMERIARAGARLDNLIGDLLDFTRLERGQMKMTIDAVEVRGVVADAVRRVGPALEHHQVDIDVADGLVVQADGLALSHVLENLLTNAAKFSAEGSTISVQARTDGREVALVVGDAGVGIPSDELARVFDRFYRVGGETNRRPGTGVGLAIVKEFTEAQGGRVLATSVLGEGSQFTVFLPAG